MLPHRIPGNGGGVRRLVRCGDDERRATIEAVLADGPQIRDPPDRLPPDLVLYVDGSSRGNPGPAGAGAVLGTDDTELARLGRPVGSQAGNNVAEYAALQLGLDAAITRFDATGLEVRIDSRTVIDDVWGGEANATPTGSTGRPSRQTSRCSTPTAGPTSPTTSQTPPTLARPSAPTSRRWGPETNPHESRVASDQLIRSAPSHHHRAVVHHLGAVRERQDHRA